jgi:hypothetical protein
VDLSGLERDFRGRGPTGRLHNEALNLSRRFAPRRLTPVRYRAVLRLWGGKVKLSRSDMAWGLGAW